MKNSLVTGFAVGAIVAGSSAFALANADHHTTTPTTEPVSLPSKPSTDAARQVYSAAKDSVAYISAETSEGTATGSGFVVSSDGKIVTNEHVVDGAQQVQVKIGTHGSAQSATVLAADASKDLALLKVDESGLK